ncbi:6-phosphogluconolactonase [Aquisalinus luteolus]|uniref:6-phosphogluconolactonase n=2 Tax=Aquisalinus luteolus TaxID=1566827 RepID=A0A8J3A4K1_9PROT|nr:6-phosphogluconolactonase [Aquisalinus luteolus]GGH93445.1 6-phosphogluconolactonase [Aquisalinus luteolus]
MAHDGGDTGLISFPGEAAMAARLADLIAAQLAAAVEDKGRASFAVSGGSTPKLLYQHLSQRDLNWSKVDVVLVDERWVEPGEEGSNETFIVENLMQNRASAARLTGMKNKAASPAEGLSTMEACLSGISFPLDVTVLGMGGDGHTASWFPNAQGLDAALDPNGRDRAAAITATESEVTGKFLQRMTLTLPPVANSGLIVLMMKGEGKRDAYEKALGEGAVADMPVRALLRLHESRSLPFWPCWTA